MTKEKRNHAAMGVVDRLRAYVARHASELLLSAVVVATGVQLIAQGSALLLVLTRLDCARTLIVHQRSQHVVSHCLIGVGGALVGAGLAPLCWLSVR